MDCKLIDGENWVRVEHVSQHIKAVEADLESTQAREAASRAEVERLRESLGKIQSMAVQANVQGKLLRAADVLYEIEPPIESAPSKDKGAVK